MSASAPGELFTEEDLALKIIRQCNSLTEQRRHGSSLKTTEVYLHSSPPRSCWVVVGEERGLPHLV
jgi:hypothetical protein